MERPLLGGAVATFENHIDKGAYPLVSVRLRYGQFPHFFVCASPRRRQFFYLFVCANACRSKRAHLFVSLGLRYRKTSHSGFKSRTSGLKHIASDLKRGYSEVSVVHAFIHDSRQFN